MKLRSFASVLSVLGFGLVACGGGGDLSGLCDKAEECAVKAGTKFSISSCQTTAKEEAEKADTAGCGGEYGDYASCATGLDFECSDDANKKILAECGAEAKNYNACINK